MKLKRANQVRTRSPYSGRHLASVSCLALLVSMMTMNSAVAQGLTMWNGSADSDWNNPTNWSDGVPGSGSLTLIDTDDTEARLTTDDAETREFSVGFSNSGSLVIEDGGRLEADGLTQIGVNGSARGAVRVTGEGSALISSSDLRVGNSGTGTLLIKDGGRVENTDGYIGRFASSSGLVLVTGAGSEWINTGNLLVAEGNDGVLVIQQGGRVESTQTDLALGVNSEGYVIIGADPGDDAQAPGILETEILRFGNGDGTLIFNHTGTNYVFSADMTGSGRINHHGGVTLLAGDSSDFTGITTILDGRITVAGALGGYLTIGSDGVLRGTGTVGNVNVSGILAPGSSVGTLTTTGDVTFNPDSVFRVYVDGGGASLLDVGGTALINGGSVEAISLLPDEDTGVVGTHTILQSAGLTGEFDGVSANFAFLDPLLSYDANNVYLVLDLLQDDDLGELSQPFAMNANQAALSGSLGSIDEDDLRYDSFYDTFISLDEDDVTPVLEEMSGSRLAGATMLVIPAASSLVDTIQISDGRGAPSSNQGLTSWARVIGSSGRQSSRDGMPGSDIRSSGIQAGFEMPVNDALSFGAALGYQQGRVSSAGLSRSDNDILSLAVHTRYQTGGLRLSGALGYSNIDITSARNVPGFGQQTADINADLWIADAGIAYDLDMGTPGLTVAPLAGLRYTSLRQDAFSETGAAGLDVSSFRSDSVRARLGVELGYDMQTAAGTTVAVKARAAWSRELASPDTSLSASLLGGDMFDVSGQGLPRDMATLGLSVQADLRDNIRIAAGYDASLGTGFEDHRVQAGVNFTW